MAKNSTPLQGLIFRKAVSTVMDNLGIDYEIINKLNLIKIWQLEVATQVVLKGSFPRGRFEGVTWWR